MTIKHLVISGGGPIMIQIMSAIQELERKEYLNMENIESVIDGSDILLAGSVKAPQKLYGINGN